MHGLALDILLKSLAQDGGYNAASLLGDLTAHHAGSSGGAFAGNSKRTVLLVHLLRFTKVRYCTRSCSTGLLRVGRRWLRAAGGMAVYPWPCLFLFYALGLSFCSLVPSFLCPLFLVVLYLLCGGNLL